MPDLYLDPPHAPLEQVRRSLARAVRMHLDHLDVEFEEGTLVLVGSVDSWYQKQVAQESARRIAGVSRVRNQLHVNPR